MKRHHLKLIAFIVLASAVFVGTGALMILA